MTQQAAQRFDTVAANFAASEVHKSSPTMVRLLELLALPAGASVCDVACGAGHLGLAFAAAGARLVSVDPAPAMLEQVRTAAADRGVEVETVLSAAEAIPLPDASFDAVVSRLAPHHFGDVQQAVREMARLTKPGGAVAVIDLQGHPDPAVDAVLHEIEVLHDPTHARNYTVEQWRSFFEQAGLVIEVVEPDQRESPQGVPIARWCQIAGSPDGAEEEINRVLTGVSADVLDELRISRDDDGFRYPVRTVLAVGRPAGKG